MAKILCIDTATKACSVAIGVDGETADTRIIQGEKYSHAENLHLMIQELLTANGFTPSDLDAVAVSEGPGSYTGLRIGVSAAKGFCFGLDIPLIAVSTLRLMCENPSVPKSNADFFCPMIDARRNEVFTALYQRDGSIHRPMEALVLDEHPYFEYLNEHRIVFFGDGAAKFEDQLDHQNALFIPDVVPEASCFTGLADTLFRKKAFQDVAYFEPFYGKEFQAGKPKKSV